MALFGSIRDDIRHAYRHGNMVTKLMMVNFVIFVVVNLVKFGLWMANGGQGIPDYFDTGLHWFCMPAQWFTFLTHPWGLFSSMFLHEDFWHLINNIIFLYLFGTICSDLIGERRVLPIYLLGGVTGNLLFVLSDFFMHYPVPYALGASGAVMALAAAVLILAPDYRVMLLLLGEVKVKYIVLVMVLLDLVGIAHESNTGGHIAHIGGFAMGCWFVYRLRDGHDMAEPINRWLDRLVGLFSGRTRRPAKPVHRKTQAAFKTQAGSGKGGSRMSDNSGSYQEELDRILEKIKAYGYENLTPEEKEFLFNASKK